MKVTDLRIGNWVYSPSLGGDVKALSFDFLSQFYEEAKPIPLTEQWLEDFGGTNPYGNIWFIGKMKFDFNNMGVCRFHWSQKITYLDYVHQLQNVTYALTGEELKKRPVKQKI